MKFFLTETNTRNRLPYGINANRAVDVRYANRKSSYRRFYRADRLLSGKVQADMITFSEGLSNALIVGVPCLPKSSRKESGTTY